MTNTKKRKITQENIADYIKISYPFLSEIKSGNKYLGKNNALRISKQTGLTAEFLLLKNGKEFYQAIYAIYAQTIGR